MSLSNKSKFLKFRNAVILTSIFLILFSSYKIIAYQTASSKNKKTYSEIERLYYKDVLAEQIKGPKIVASISHSDEQIDNVQIDELQMLEKVDQPQVLLIQNKFNELLKKNEEVVGWLKIEGTVIDYPIAQAVDNEFYLKRDIYKEKSVAGSIFMDYRDDIESENKNTILYGHYMKNGSMFGELKNYKRKSNFENNSIIEFDTLYNSEKWEIFSVYTTDVNFDYIRTDFNTKQEYKFFLDTLQSKSIHKSDVKLTEDDVILTLSTCSYDFSNARFVVHAKLIKG